MDLKKNYRINAIFKIFHNLLEIDAIYVYSSYYFVEFVFITVLFEL